MHERTRMVAHQILLESARRWAWSCEVQVADFRR